MEKYTKQEIKENEHFLKFLNVPDIDILDNDLLQRIYDLYKQNETNKQILGNFGSQAGNDDFTDSDSDSDDELDGGDIINDFLDTLIPVNNKKKRKTNKRRTRNKRKSRRTNSRRNTRKSRRTRRSRKSRNTRRR